MVNSLTLIGRVGQNPEFRTLESGTKLSSCSLAVSKKYKDKSGETKEDTMWINVEAWGNLAEIFDKYVTKGSLIYVSGELKIDNFEKDGIKQQRSKIVVRDMQMLGGKKEESTQHGSMSQPSQSQGTVLDEIDSEELPFYL